MGNNHNTPGDQHGADTLRLLETAACLAAAGYGPQASFGPIGHYILSRLDADRVLLLRISHDRQCIPLASVPALSGSQLIGQSYRYGPWLDEALSRGSSTTILSDETLQQEDEIGRTLCELGASAAAAVRVGSETDQPLVLVVARRREFDNEDMARLTSIVAGLEAGLRVARCPVVYAANPASAIATADQMAAVTQLAATLAHDLNNALSAILGQTELLLEELKGDPRAERVRRISGRTMQLMGLARALEEYANAQLVGQVEDADLGELAREAVEATRCVWEAEARARNCHIEMHCEIEEPTPIRVVPAQVKRSLVHLIFNAIQAIGDRDGSIHVRVWRDGFFAACSITDNGVGMPPDVLRRCREPFFTTRPGVCKGLGLSLAEATARRHGGDLEIHSTPGQGTTVTMYIPIRADGRARQER